MAGAAAAAAAANGSGAAATTGGAGSPCGACKFLRRRCVAECVFAPYFSSEQGAARFAAIHKVFGASNASKLLSQLPVGERCEAVVTITYEAQARLRDPVYGCVAHIFALQQQVAILQAQLMQAKAHLACGGAGVHVHHQGSPSPSPSPATNHHHHQYCWPAADSATSSISALLRQQHDTPRIRPIIDDCELFMPEQLMAPDVKVDAGGDLQYLAQAMMRSPNYYDSL